MGLRFDPVGGGQFKAAIKQIVEAERQPIKSLEARKVREEARMKLFQEFKTKFGGISKALNEFNSFKSFRDLKVDLGDGAAYMSVTLDKERAEPGTYSMQIDQIAARTSIITNGFEDPDKAVAGIGFIVAEKKDGETAEIFIDEDKASPRGIAVAINQRDDLPFRASVVKDMADPERPWRIIMSAKPGEKESGITFPEFYFLDGNEDLYIDDENESRNAILALDGFAIESEANDIKDFLMGVNVHLKQARPEQPFTMTISEDYQKIAGKMKGLIDQINGVLEFINKQNQIDERTDTKSTFAGDTGLQNIEYRFRNLLHEGFPVGDPESEEFRFIFLNQIGAEFEKTGQIVFKEDKFQKALEGDFEGIAEAVTGEFGLARQMRAVLDGYTRSGNGILTIREQGIRNSIKKLDDDIAQKERRVEQKQQALVEKFSRLQSTIADMQQQQQSISAALPGGGGGNMLAQLLGS